MICTWYLAQIPLVIFKIVSNFTRLTAVKLRITISKYHLWYLCQISLQIMLLPVPKNKSLEISTCKPVRWVRNDPTFKQQKTFSVFAQPDINTRGVGRIRDSYANPRRTVENSPSASRVNIRLCKHRKKVFYCFYKITFPRKT